MKTGFHVRYAFLFLTFVLATLVTSCTTQSPAQPGVNDNRLVVLDWAGYDAPHYWATFAEQHPNTKVDFTFFEQDADAFAKLQTGFEVDLLHPCSSWWGLYVEAGLVQPIDTSRLGNWESVSPRLAELGQFNGEQYFIPWEWGYESIIVRTDKIDPLPTAWADLWNPAYAGHLAIPDGAEANQLMAALVTGVDNPWQTSAAEDALIQQKLTDLKANVLTYWTDSTELSQLIASGDVWIASNVWQDTFGTLQQDGVPVAYIQPDEGRLGWVCGYGISRQTNNLDLAHDYLDALLDPASIANLGNEYWYGVSNQAAFALIDSEVVRMFQLDQPEILDQTIFYQTMSAEHRQKIITMWDAVKLAR